MTRPDKVPINSRPTKRRDRRLEFEKLRRFLSPFIENECVLPPVRFCHREFKKDCSGNNPRKTAGIVFPWLHRMPVSTLLGGDEDNIIGI